MSFADRRMIGVSINSLTGITGRCYGFNEMIRAAVTAETSAPSGSGCTTRLRAPDDGLVRQRVSPGRDPHQHAHARHGRAAAAPARPVALTLSRAPLHCPSGGRAIMDVGSGAGKSVLVERQFEALAALRHTTDLDPSALYAQDVAAQLRRFQERGVHIFQLVVASPDHIAQMQRIGEQVLPLLHE